MIDDETRVPRYRSCQQKEAYRIARIIRANGHGRTIFVLEKNPPRAVSVCAGFVREYGPESGGYYAVSSEGRESYLPAEMFNAPKK